MPLVETLRSDCPTLRRPLNERGGFLMKQTRATAYALNTCQRRRAHWRNTISGRLDLDMCKKKSVFVIAK